MCKYYGCKNVPESVDGYCEQHDYDFCRDDMARYKLYKEEGYSSYQAAVYAGVCDPYYGEDN